LRGGGAGSWGVIIDATFSTLPIFNATIHIVNVLTTTLDQTASLMTTHAKHINDWDQVRAGQTLNLTMGSTTNYTLAIFTFFKDLDGDASKAQMSSFLADAAKLGAAVQEETTVTTLANDIASLFPDDPSGYNAILSSRLVPGSVYSNAPESVGLAYKQLFSHGMRTVLGLLVGGGTLDFRDVLWCYPKLTTHVGQVAANAHIDSAIIPAWRSAKTHVSILPDTVLAESNLTSSTRLSPTNSGTIPCPRRMSRRCERILPRQLDLCSRGLLVASPVVVTQTRATCSSQTFASRSLAPTIHVLRRSSLRTTLTIYLSSQSGSAVNCGTRKGCVRYDEQ
jgi:hypothetical protein